MQSTHIYSFMPMPSSQRTFIHNNATKIAITATSQTKSSRPTKTRITERIKRASPCASPPSSLRLRRRAGEAGQIPTELLAPSPGSRADMKRFLQQPLVKQLQSQAPRPCRHQGRAASRQTRSLMPRSTRRPCLLTCRR
jgi:hypothetical protein